MRLQIANCKMQIGVAGLLVFGATLAVSAAAIAPVPQTAEQAPGLVERFLAPEQAPLVSYRAFRRLTASTRGGKMRAAIDVVTSLDPVQGFTFEITSQEGSGTIRNKVLLPALEAEVKAVNASNGEQTALTPANYEFLGITPGDGDLKRVGIRPRRKHAMLIDGAVFLAGDTADLVRVEGEPSERPSFWTRHVKIVREYARVGGVRVPVSMRSTADVLIVGASDFSMTYRYVEINGAPIQ